VNKLDLKVKQNTIHGFLLGPNGAGKTTTIKILVCLLRADEGRVRILGKEVYGDMPEGNQIPIATSISTGTDASASNFVSYVLSPSANVTFTRLGNLTLGQPTLIPVYTEALSLVLLRSVLVALAYTMAFILIAWIAFK
jgi:ABC-type cobalamin/Fe3+-siderophores transport system ATPase subunit